MMKMPDWIKFGGKKNKSKEKNTKLTGEVIRIRVNRLINNSPVEIGVFDAELMVDENKNTILTNVENNFKEEIPDLVDSLVSDVLYKLEARTKSVDEQKKEVNKKIDELEEQIKNDKEGYVEGKKINITTLKTNLNLLKCILYVLDNKKGDGFFESIELDGTRCLKYLVRDGDLIPYWYKTPNHNGEPVILVPDIVQRKKFWREATDETIQDFNESQDTFWRGLLGFLTKVLFVLFFAGLLFWTFYNARWSSDLHDESLQPEIDRLKLQNEQIRQSCSNAIKNQIENNGILIDYAKLLITNQMNKTNNADTGGTPKDLNI